MPTLHRTRPPLSTSTSLLVVLFLMTGVFGFSPNPQSASFHSRTPSTHTHTTSGLPYQSGGDVPSEFVVRQQQWFDKSSTYYSKVMREKQRQKAADQSFQTLANHHYFALRKIKDNKPQHAEHIYRRIIGELDQDDCDHAKLAVTTLLLALLLQRTGNPKQTRSVFLHFFRIVQTDDVEQCACSAKVLQAFALFEMKQGNELKSLELVQKAIALDTTLQPVLNWKQFRDAKQRKQERRRTFEV